MHHIHALQYSADPTVTIKQLLSSDYICPANIDAVQKRLDENDVHTMVRNTSHYFFGLSLIPSPPYIVYAQGNIELLQKSKLAIVGPRRMTEYARQVLDHIFAYLVNYDVVTISGGAEGVDMTCHALSIHNNIPTIVILGGGLRWYWHSRFRGFLEKVLDADGFDSFGI